tara:strand:- start:2 stop:853 length:852 start_codon:yes stop_codon:yes gene_type:complete
MPDAALLSIITITYNNHDGLLATAASLAVQSRKHFKWIIIDGKSTDKTAAVLPHLNPAPDIIIREPDTGIYDAMNKGIMQAGGAYSMFLNAGDTLPSPETLACIIQKLEQDTPDFLYGDSYETAAAGNSAKPGLLRHYKKARHHTKRAWGLFTHHQSMIYKTDILKTLRYNTDYKIAADYDLTLRFLRLSRTITYLPLPLSVFCAGGASQRRSALGRTEQFIIRRALNIVPLWLNVLIFIAQWLNWQFKAITPNVYWFLKRSSRSAGNKDSGSAPADTRQNHP